MPAKADKNRSASKGKREKGSPAPKRHTYLEMVQVAILTLNEGGGATRQAIWKCVEARFPDQADHKRFLIAMRKLSADGGAIVKGKNNQRFTLERKFLKRGLKRMQQGLPLQVVLSSKFMTDLRKKKISQVGKKPKKDKKKNADKKAGDRKSRGKSGSAKKGAAKGAKGGKDKAGASVKDKIKAKAKQNKKTAGNDKSNAKVADKRKTAEQKVKASNKANKNKMDNGKAKKEDQRKSKGKAPGKPADKKADKKKNDVSKRSSSVSRKSAAGEEKLRKSKDIRKSSKSTISNKA